MLQKKFFKILSVFVAVIIVFSCFCISASAATVYKININQPRADNYSGYIEYLIKTTDGAIVPFVSFWHVTGSANFLDDVDIGYPTVYITVSANRIYMCAIYEGCENNSTYTFSLNGGSVNGYGGSNYWSVTSSTTTADTNAYIGTGTVLAYKLYGNYKNLNSISSSSLDFNISYSETSVLYEALLTMAQASASSSGAITQNATDNANKIQQNQDENTDKIIQNQEENQEEIKNGWEQDEEIDTSTTDDYAAKDKELQEATEQGRSEAVSVFNSFGSLFQSDGHLYKGLLSVSAMFTEFMKIDWLSSLLNFSLAIGIFAFVIGTGSEIFKSSHERYKDAKISKIDSYDERWLM